jgi:hypothetical protein
VVRCLSQFFNTLLADPGNASPDHSSSWGAAEKSHFVLGDLKIGTPFAILNLLVHGRSTHAGLLRRSGGQRLI